MMERCALCDPDCAACAWDRAHPDLPYTALVRDGDRLLCQTHAEIEEEAASG